MILLNSSGKTHARGTTTTIKKKMGSFNVVVVEGLSFNHTQQAKQPQQPRHNFCQIRRWDDRPSLSLSVRGDKCWLWYSEYVSNNSERVITILPLT
jgi:hypothetical protein